MDAGVGIETRRGKGEGRWQSCKGGREDELDGAPRDEREGEAVLARLAESDVAGVDVRVEAKGCELVRRVSSTSKAQAKRRCKTH